MPFEMNLHNVEASLSITLCRVILIAITGDPIFYGMDDLISGTGNDKMIFADSIEPWLLWGGLVLGVVSLLLVGYFFKYQDHMKNHPEKEIKFELRYTVAAILTAAASIFGAYFAVFHGLDLFISEEISEPGLAVCISFAVGAILAYLVDGAFFHAIADGRSAQVFNKGQKIIREQLATEEAQKAITEAVVAKAKEFGVISDAGLAFVRKHAKSVDDPDFLEIVSFARQKQ